MLADLPVMKERTTMTKLYLVTAHYKEPLWSYSKQFTNIAVLAKNKIQALKLAIPAFNSIKEEALMEDEWHSCTYSVKRIQVNRPYPEVLGSLDFV